MSDSRSWFGRHLVGVQLLALSIVGAALVGVVALGGLVGLASLDQPLGAFVGALLPWLAATLGLSVVGLALVLTLAWTLVRRARLPRSERLSALVATVEKRNEWAEAVNLSARLKPREPTADESAVETLKRRYAEGELSEREFERRMEALLDGEDRMAREFEERERLRGR
jgi:hypothetical protein